MDEDEARRAVRGGIYDVLFMLLKIGLGVVVLYLIWEASQIKYVGG